MKIKIDLRRKILKIFFFFKVRECIEVIDYKTEKKAFLGGVFIVKISYQAKHFRSGYTKRCTQVLSRFI